MKTGEQKIASCTDEYGKVQDSPREQPCALTQIREERCAAVEFPADEQLTNRGHTLLSYCEVATAESDDNSEADEDNGDDGPPRRHFKTANSEPCKYSFSILPHSKRLRAVQKKDFVPSSKNTIASHTAVFDFPDSQVHSKQKKCQIAQEDKTVASRRNHVQQVLTLSSHTCFQSCTSI